MQCFLSSSHVKNRVVVNVVLFFLNGWKTCFTGWYFYSGLFAQNISDISASVCANFQVCFVCFINAALFLFHLHLLTAHFFKWDCAKNITWHREFSPSGRFPRGSRYCGMFSEESIRFLFPMSLIHSRKSNILNFALVAREDLRKIEVLMSSCATCESQKQGFRLNPMRPQSTTFLLTMFCGHKYRLEGVNIVRSRSRAALETAIITKLWNQVFVLDFRPSTKWQTIRLWPMGGIRFVKFNAKWAAPCFCQDNQLHQLVIKTFVNTKLPPRHLSLQICIHKNWWWLGMSWWQIACGELSGDNQVCGREMTSWAERSVYPLAGCKSELWTCKLA